MFIFRISAGFKSVVSFDFHLITMGAKYFK